MPSDGTDPSAPGLLPGAVDGATSTPGVGTVPATSGPDAAPGALPEPSAGAPVGIPGTTESPGTVEPPLPFEPAPGLLRRLTRTQFRNAVRDVFGVEVDVRELDADNWDGDFATIGAASVVTSERGVEQYQAAVENAVASVFDDPTRQQDFIGCTPSTEDESCTRSFVERVGRRAWRRPLEVTEVDRLVTLASSAGTELESAVEGVRWVTIALFTSPHFLYRAELGTPASDGSLRFVGYESASRLSFLLWNSLPDEALLDEAANGALDTEEGVRDAAARMLDAPLGREAVGAFAEQYMRLDRIATQAKDPALFPEYGAALQDAMVRDMRSVWESVVFDDRTSALGLFTTTKAFVNSDLARLYGLEVGNLDSNTFEERSLPSQGTRVGILGKAGFLSQFANQKEGSPTLRGKFMRQALMCTKVPDPPGDVDLELDEPPADMPQTKRQRLEAHRANATCATCHALMDPLGLPFESFDAIGRYRTEEHGLTIDPSGEFDGQAVANSVELGATLGTSDAVASCLVRKYYSYALGIEARDVDIIVLNELVTAFEGSGYQFRELILETVAHEAFSTVAAQVDASEVSQ